MLSGTRLQKLAFAGVLASLTLWSTSVFAGQGGNSPVDPPTLRQYYQTNNLVGLFDALVLRDGQEARVLKPTRLTLNREFFGDLRLLPGVQEVLTFMQVEVEKSGASSGGGTVVHFEGTGTLPFETWTQNHLRELSAEFGTDETYTAMFRGHVNLIESARADFIEHHADEWWAGCMATEVSQDDAGQLVARSSATRGSIVTVYFSRIPLSESLAPCVLKTALFGIGLGGILDPQLSGLMHMRRNKAFAGPAILCALRILRDDRVEDGMPREEALTIVSDMQDEGMTCD